MADEVTAQLLRFVSTEFGRGAQIGVDDPLLGGIVDSIGVFTMVGFLEKEFRILGIDPRPVLSGAERKSLGHESTFSEDIHDRTTVRHRLLELVDAVTRGEPPEPGLGEAVVAHRLVDAAYRSAHDGGRPVGLEG